MMRIHLRTLHLAITAAAVALPASAQRRADLAPSIIPASTPAAGTTVPVGAIGLDASDVIAVQPGVMDPRLIAPMREDHRPAEMRRLSTGGHVAIGATAGAVLGAALAFAEPHCWQGDSFCGVALIGTVPLGAIVGAGAGYLVAKVR